MEHEAEISFAITYDGSPENVERLKEAVVARCGLSMEDLDDVSTPDLVRYILDTQTALLSELGVAVHDSSAQEITPSTSVAPRI
jgi:hypothetical protein